LEHNRKNKELNMIKHSLQIGSILYSSWGYEQTNIDFYEVTKLIGKCTVELRELAQIAEQHDYCAFSGKTRPIPSNYIEQPIKKRVNEYGRVKISSCQSARLWDGEGLYYSSYY
jgi:hypothetical protein